MFKIDEKVISLLNKSFIIAEVGINHNGEISKAIEMIKVAKKCGADCVKFQTFKAIEFVGDEKQMFTYNSQGKEVTESMLKMFQRYEFNNNEWGKLKQICNQEGILFMSTPQNLSDLEILLLVGVPAIKIGSDDFTNIPLIKSYAEKNTPLILSCGMSDLSDVHKALYAAGWFDGKMVALLLCTSQYPTSTFDVNISKLRTLQDSFPGLIVGFSDHTQGSLSAAMAYTLGARIFEKHFTLDSNLPGPDHWFSETPESLKSWIKTIRDAEDIYGKPFILPTKNELEVRKIARRSIIAIRDIIPGDEFTLENIGLRRPGVGISPEHINVFLGQSSKNKIKKGDYIFFKDLN